MWSLKRYWKIGFIAIIVISGMSLGLLSMSISSGIHEYELSDPAIDLRIPNALYWNNISEGVTGQPVLSFELADSGLDSGAHHIRLSAFNLTIWIRDLATNECIPDVVIFDFYVSNYTPPPLRAYYRTYNRTGDYDPQLLNLWSNIEVEVLFNVYPDDYVQKLGAYIELAFINSLVGSYGNHNFSIEVEYKFIYALLWNGIVLNQAHQIITERVMLTDSKGLQLLEEN